MICNVCGREVPDGTKFCPYCGTLLAQNETEGQPEVHRCISCGMEIPENAMFCKYCGAKQKEGEAVFVRQTPEKGKGQGSLIIIGAVALAVVLLVGFLLFGAKRIKPESFIDVTFDDTLNGYSSAYVHVDYDKLDEIIGKDRIKSGTLKLIKSSPEIQAFLKVLGVSAEEVAKDVGSDDFFEVNVQDPGHNLKNGDEVVIDIVPGDIFSELGMESVTLSEACKCLGVSLPAQYKVKVSGLDSGTEITLLPKSLAECVTFKGAEDHGWACFDLPSYYELNGFALQSYGYNYCDVYKDDVYRGYIYLEVAAPGDKSPYVLSTGDKVTVSILPDADLAAFLLSKRMVIADKPATLTVGELGKFMTTFSAQDIKELSKSMICDAIYRNLRWTSFTAYKVEKKDNGGLGGNSKTGIVYVLKSPKKTTFFYQGDIFKYDVATAEYVNTINYKGDKDEASIISALQGYATSVERIPDYQLASPQEALQGYTAKVNSSDVRARKGPGTNYGILTIKKKKQHYKKGAEYLIQDARPDKDGRMWYQVNYKYNGKTYQTWVTSQYSDLYKKNR